MGLGLVGPFLVAAALPLLLLGLFVVFRWRYLRLMTRTIYSSTAQAPDPESTPHHREGSAVPLVIDWYDAASAAGQTRPRELGDALEATRSMRMAFGVAAAVFIVTQILVVWAVFRDRGFTALVALATAYSFSLPGFVVLLAFARASGRQIVATVAAYFALSFLMLFGPLGLNAATAFASTRLAVTVNLWLLAGIGLLLLRRTRTLLVAFVPIVLVLIALMALLFVILTGAGVTDLSSSPLIRVLGTISFAAGLGLVVREIRRGVRPRFVGVLTAMGVVAGWLPLIVRLPRPAYLMLLLASGVATNALMALFVWWGFRQFMRLKERGWLPDEVLQFHLCWLFLTTLTFAAFGTRPTLLLPLVASAVILQVMLRRLQRAAALKPSRRLLLLRVFGTPPIRLRLLDLLDETWRRTGRVDLVAGADVALRTLDVSALDAFIIGRFQRLYIKTDAEAVQRVRRLQQRPGLDGRYPLNELHCLPDTWQQVVRLLADGADAVLLDLRHFRVANTGATFELSLVVQRIPLARIVLLVDSSSDEPVLANVIHHAWTQLPDDSPNSHLRDARLRLLRCSGSRSTQETAIAHAVFAAAFATPSN